MPRSTIAARRSPLAIAAVLLIGLATAAPAAGRTYNVYGLGQNGAGCLGWSAYTNAATKFTQYKSCTEWYTEARSRTAYAYGDLAGAAMRAPTGTVFTGFALDAQVTMDTRNGGPGFTWRMDSCPSSGSCTARTVVNRSAARSRYVIGTLASQSSLSGRAIHFRLYCHQLGGCDHASNTSRPAFANHFNSHAVIDDYTRPRIASMSGVSTGWNSGPLRLTYSAGDVGGGVERVGLAVDGGLPQSISHSCLRVPGGGYRSPTPCAATGSGSFPVNAGGTRLADGAHSLTVTTHDAAGNTSGAQRSFKVDNHAPGTPADLSLSGGQAWRSTNGFDVSWRNPPQGGGAPVVAAYYKVGSPPASPSDGRRIPGTDIERLTNIMVPRSGDYPLYVWLQDAAGNSDHGSAQMVHARLDAETPSVAFHSALDPSNPTEIRAAVRDAVSGILLGSIEFRPFGGREWRQLDTRREGGDLVAAFPDDRLPRATYEFRARVADRAGNVAVTYRKENGRPMILDSPLRVDTRIRTGISSQGSKPRRTLTLWYGRRAGLRGRLATTEGVPLSDAPVTVRARVAGRHIYRTLGQAVTSRGGGFSFRIPRGPSRRFVVSFGGTRILRPTAGLARLRVRARATLRLSPKRLRVGRRLVFRGRVRGSRLHVPRRGKLVQVQFRDGRHWRPAIRLGRTNRAGRFRISYRFRRITRPTRIRFRILVPAEGGWPFETGWSRTRRVDVYPKH